jgi:hypothetical protein
LAVLWKDKLEGPQEVEGIEHSKRASLQPPKVALQSKAKKMKNKSNGGGGVRLEDEDSTIFFLRVATQDLADL